MEDWMVEEQKQKQMEEKWTAKEILNTVFLSLKKPYDW